MFIRLREMARRRTTRSKRSKRNTRRVKRSNTRRTSRKQRGGMLALAREYPDALITTYNEEMVPQTQSVESFYEDSDLNPDTPAPDAASL
jgi:hypothetical protein